MIGARNVAVLLGLLVVASGLAYLANRANVNQEAPPGSSTSYQADGTQALYQWVEALGGRPVRLEEPAIDSGSPPALLFVVQPRITVNGASRRAFEAVARRGGTIVIAADSFAAIPYLQALDVTPDPVVAVGSAASADATLRFPIVTQRRVRANGATPLLLSQSGDWLALRRPYLQGSVVVIGSPYPLTNQALRNPDNARWVLRELLGPARQGAVVAFDEAHYSERTRTAAEPAFNAILAGSDLGRALIFGTLVLFLYLVLTGRRLGPPVPPLDAARGVRTMYEHVQALAGLYRRGRQFLYLRDHFERHYRRLVARSLGVDVAVAHDARLADELAARGLPADQARRLASALAELGAARGDAQLLRAVAHAEEAVSVLPRTAHGTLSAV